MANIPLCSTWIKSRYLDNCYEFNTTVSGRKVEVYVEIINDCATISHFDQNNNEIDKIIKKRIHWIEENINKIKQSVVKSELFELVDDWVSSSRKCLDTEDQYIMEDGFEVRIPVSRNEFQKSLYLENIVFCINFNTIYEIEGTIYLSCLPDFFAGHQIDVTISPDFNLSVGSLVG